MMSSQLSTIMSWAKENFQLITLFVGLVGVVVSFISVAYEVRKKKKEKEKEKKKQ